MAQGCVGIILALCWFDYQVLVLLTYTKESVGGNTGTPQAGGGTSSARCGSSMATVLFPLEVGGGFS